MENLYDTWKRECELTLNSISPEIDFEQQGEVALDAAKRLLAIARQLNDVACMQCAGFGEIAYGSTDAWRGGIGGQQITPGTCDGCWGTGRKDRTGPNLRTLKYQPRR